MDSGRNKKPIAISEEVLREARHITEDFKNYIDGVRLVLLIYRSKEGAESANGDKYKKYISNGKEEFFKALCKALEVCKNKPEIPFRIYSSLNPRNVDKAIRLFKQEQLDADYYDTVSKQSFYLDIKNRFISSLMTPSSRGDNKFLIDCDSNDGQQAALTKLDELRVHVYNVFPTKNGWHLITDPFNPELLGVIPDVEIKKDGILLLHF